MTKNESLISVIVTAYNIEKYLPRCMDSLLKQTYENLEIILVDDGSTDKTPEICDAYDAKSNKIKVIHKENGGPSAARNAGLSIASGAFIGYVDGDDYIEPDMYKDMFAACMESGAEIAICTYREVGKGSREQKPTGNVIELNRQKALEWYAVSHLSLCLEQAVQKRIAFRYFV